MKENEVKKGLSTEKEGETNKRYERERKKISENEGCVECSGERKSVKRERERERGGREREIVLISKDNRRDRESRIKEEKKNINKWMAEWMRNKENSLW